MNLLTRNLSWPLELLRRHWRIGSCPLLSSDGDPFCFIARSTDGSSDAIFQIARQVTDQITKSLASGCRLALQPAHADRFGDS